jgi:hypothetical protein
MFLIDDIFGAPAKGFMGIVKVLYDRAYEELYDPNRIREELMAYQLKLDMGEISEEAYEAKETELLERLEYSQHMQQQK